MLWVERRAQLQALVSSVVIKPGAGNCENACISNWPTTWHSYRFQKFEPHVFYFSPSSLCLESFFWDLFGVLGEIVGEVLDHRSDGGHKLANISRAWLGGLVSTPKVAFLLPNLTHLQISEVSGIRFLLQSICRMRGKFRWDSFSGLGEIAI